MGQLRFDFEGAGINRGDLILIGEIRVDHSFSVGHGEFGRAAQIDGLDHVAGFGVDHGGAVAIAIHGEDALR